MKNKKGLVSIVIPVYNTSKYLPQCVESILNQTYQNIEVILVDDCSTDNSYSIAKSYSDRDERIILIKSQHNSNRGASYARNLGMSYVSGEFLTFVDSDDFIEPNYCEVFVRNIKNNDLGLCNQYFYEERRGKLIKQNFEFDKHLKILDNPPVSYVFDDIIPGYVSSKFYKTQSIEKLRFEESLFIAEDNVFIWKYIEKGSKITYVNDYLYMYRRYKVARTNFKKKSFISFIIKFMIAMLNFRITVQKCLFYYALKPFYRLDKTAQTNRCDFNLKFYRILFDLKLPLLERYRKIRQLKVGCTRFTPSVYFQYVKIDVTTQREQKSLSLRNE